MRSLAPSRSLSRCRDTTGGLCEYLFDHLSVHIGEAKVTTQILECQLLVSDPKTVQDGGLKVVNVDRVSGDVVAVIVRLSQDHARFHAATSHPHGKAAGVVIAAVIVLSQWTLAINRSAELPSPNHQSVVQHTPLFEILDESRGGLIRGLTLFWERGRVYCQVNRFGTYSAPWPLSKLLILRSTNDRFLLQNPRILLNLTVPFDEFLATYQLKFPKASACLAKDQEELLAFYDFPAEPWPHLRTTNPIESTFAAVKLRTAKTRGCLSRQTLLTMVFKLCRRAEKRWRRLQGCRRLGEVIENVKFINGVREDEVAA